MKKTLDKIKIQLVVREKPTKKGRRYSVDNSNAIINSPNKQTQQQPIKKNIKTSIKIDEKLQKPKPKQMQAQLFQRKIQEYVNKKRITLNQQKYVKINNFSTMLQNIKSVLKQNDKKQRQSKTIQYQNNKVQQFQCVKSQIHQLYTNQDKIELYRMLRNSQKKNSIKKQTKIQNQNLDFNKTLQNPFLNTNTVVCFRLSLNNPQLPKRQLFQAPFKRPSTSLEYNNKKIDRIVNHCKQRPMNFKLHHDYDNQYSKKIKSFLDFIFKVNYSNNIYVSIQLQKLQQAGLCKKYKAYIGKGNNSLLIKSLLKRRFWWQIIQTLDYNQVDFVWSQNIIDQIPEKQKKTTLNQIKKSQQPTSQLLLKDNLKILSGSKVKTVQKYINSSGFTIPFMNTFTPDLISNHLPRNYCIGSKKNLFKSLFNYFTKVKKTDPFQYIPKTYHITSTTCDQYYTFINQNKKQPNKVWIVKPGQNTNRGNGINLSTFKSINQLLKKQKHANGEQFTYIIQSYINKPFLYNNRKFDIRHYMMITSVNGIIKCYWYKQGYIRTSSQIYDIQDLDNNFIHLTNDAIQRNSQDYQKYQPANKLSYSEFQRYLDYTYPGKSYNFQRDIVLKMKEIAKFIIQANYQVIDHKRNINNFQIFGLDFMIDKQFKPWLIQVNYNPCLQINCLVLQRIIPSMVQNSFRLGLDPLYPPKSHFPISKRYYLSDNYLKNLKYQLIFDSDNLSIPIQNNYDFKDVKQQQQQYQDQGKQLNQLIV